LTGDPQRVTLFAFALCPSGASPQLNVEGVLRLLGTLVLALQDPAVGSPEAASSIDILSLILHGSLIGQIILVILLVFSALSWGIVIAKSAQLKRAARQSATFLDVFRRSSRFSEVQAVCTTLSGSPLVGLFQAGYTELNAQLRGAADRPEGESSRPTLKSLDAVDRALLRASTVEVSKLEHRVSFLATTASITPYIGLFGTVWGIIMAFQSIGAEGSTSLAVVAPPIAEALVATAAGLFAAIPAVYFYNDITSQVKKAANEMDDFSMEFLTIAERNFT
jgi:biopolymer transport protein TolQ